MSRGSKAAIVFSLLTGLILIAVPVGAAVQVVLCGPEVFVRDPGSPVTETRSFAVERPVAESYVMQVQNGSMEGDSLVSSAVITLNGVVIFKQNDFGQNIHFLEKPVQVQGENTLAVNLASLPTSFITITIVGNYLPEDVDDDGDGYTENEGDCDDTDPGLNPETVWLEDVDGDGYTTGATLTQCLPPSGYVLSADPGDCDDANGDVNPSASEACNEVDDNCDGQVDEGVTVTFYLDADGDGYGVLTDTVQACSVPAGYAENQNDCDDTNAVINPSASETCNGLDDNCNGSVDEGVTITFYLDSDGDGYGDASSTVQACSVPAGYAENTDDCNDANPGINPETIWYQDADEDGYTTGVTVTQCVQPSGYVLSALAGDCNDGDELINPAASETCNGLDDNCDGQADEGVTITFYQDADGDGYGVSTGTVQACSVPAGYAETPDDCDDTSFEVNPGAPEVCDGIDNNCDGVIDPGCLTGIIVDPGSFTLTGSSPTHQLLVTGYYFDGTSQNLTGSGAGTTYSSSNTGVATVSPEGLVSVVGTGTAIITAANSGYDAQAQVTVQLLPPDYIPQPEGTFGAFYEDLVPPDIALESYDVERFAVITGFVENMNGTPIAGVKVTVHGHPEYGSVMTDAMGRFSIPVEGGESLSVVMEKTGLITIHRKAYVPWNDIAVMETAVMIPLDEKETLISFTGNSADVITHQSTPTVDEYGMRTLTMVFTGDNRAYTYDAEGYPAYHATITVSATEYPTPESMPAQLPPTVAFTYCTELTAREGDVKFEKPVTVYIDNFPGFDVGTTVPIGYYDLDRAVWVPLENGYVIRLLDLDYDGITDALDRDGDGLPDDLDQDGDYEDEVSGLDDPMDYPPNETFWRSKIVHFTPIDWNFPFVSPSDAVAKSATFGAEDGAAKEGAASSDQEGENQNFPDPCPKENSPTEAGGQTNVGSHISHRSRSTHEQISIPGTGIALLYSSTGTEGYKTLITVPASGDWVPESLEKIEVTVQLAGRKLRKDLAPLPDQTVEFEWDGLDCYGRPFVGTIPARIGVAYIYSAYYAIPADRAQAFGLASGIATTVPARQAAVFREDEQILLDRAGVGSLARGWNLSLHHRLFPTDPGVLYKGDGSTVRQTEMITETFAGNGTSVYVGDGVPATETGFGGVYTMTSDKQGNVFFCDGRWIRKIDRNGIITTIAGQYPGGSEADGIPAIEASISCSKFGDMEVDGTGNIYLTAKYTIRKIDSNGIITTIAGGCSDAAYSASTDWIGDGLPATESCVGPYGLAFDSEGNLFVGDVYWGSRIRKIDTNGVITTIAGGFEEDLDLGDGGPASDAAIFVPADIAVDSQGNVYVSTGFGSRVRKVDPHGVITTVAGDGLTAGWDIPACPLCGEGGPATEASLQEPGSLKIDDQGNVYFLDWMEDVVRKIDGSGNLKTVVGLSSGSLSVPYDCEAEGLPATAACFWRSLAFTIDGDNNFYISQPRSGKIMKISRPGKLREFYGATEIAFAEGGLVYVMSESGVHKRTVDMTSGTTLLTFDYDPADRLVAIRDRFGNTTTIQRDGSGVPVSITSPDGIVTSLTIDANGNLLKVSFEDGTHYAMDYSAGGLLAEEYHPNGNYTVFAYDPFGRITEATDETGGRWILARNPGDGGILNIHVISAEGEVVSYSDRKKSTEELRSTVAGTDGAPMEFYRSPDGLYEEIKTSCGVEYVTKYGSDPRYGLRKCDGSSVTMPSGLSMTTDIDRTYSDTNSDDIPDLITDTVAVNGKTSTVVNNVLSGTVTATSPEGRQAISYYSPATLLTVRTTTPGLLDTDFTYDTRGRLETVSVGTRTTSFAYDTYGYLDYMLTPDGRTFDYTYDVMGRLLAEDRPDGGMVDYSYDANGNVTAILNPNDIEHGFTYTGNDQRESYNTPLSGSYVYQYDRDRRLKSVIYPSGATITNTWGSGQLQSTSTPEGLVSFGYTCGSKLASVTKGGESASYTYDGSLLLTDTRTGTLNHTISYGYNADLQVNSITYAGETEGFTYDLDGLLTGVGPYTITRNASNGLPLSVSDGTVIQDRSFSGYGEVDGVDYTVGNAVPYSWGVERDNAGRITRKTEIISSETIVWEYSYDSMGRLETATRNGVLAESYLYDPQGNRIEEVNTLRGVSRNYTHDEEDKILQAGADTYTFDEDGFLVSRDISSGIYSGVATFDYSSRGELLSATLPTGDVITYSHDPMGRRVAKSINGSVVEKYLWQDSTTLLVVYDGSDNLIQRFEYADGRMPVSMTYQGSVYYFGYDQVGSLRAVTDSAGNIVKRIDYDSFGDILNDSNISFTVPFGFAGGLHERSTGLVRFGARDYDPATGKWCAKDPIDFAGGDLNLLGYCLADPVNWVDPEGCIIQALTAGSISGVIVGGVSFISELAQGKSISQAAQAAIISGATAGVSVALTTSGIGFLWSGAAASATNALLQKAFYGEIDPCAALLSGYATSAGGALLGNLGKFGPEPLTGWQSGIIGGSILSPVNLAVSKTKN